MERSISTLFWVVVVLAQLLFLIDVSGKPEETNPAKSGGKRPRTLTFLGNLEGKSFFMEDGVSMNWTDAFTYCKQFNLELATLNTKQQLYFVGGALVNRSRTIGLKTQYFWTAAFHRQGGISQEYNSDPYFKDTITLVERNVLWWGPNSNYNPQYGNCGNYDVGYGWLYHMKKCTTVFKGAVCQTH